MQTAQFRLPARIHFFPIHADAQSRVRKDHQSLLFSSLSLSLIFSFCSFPTLSSLLLIARSLFPSLFSHPLFCGFQTEPRMNQSRFQETEEVWPSCPLQTAKRVPQFVGTKILSRARNLPRTDRSLWKNQSENDKILACSAKSAGQGRAALLLDRRFDIEIRRFNFDLLLA